MYLLNSITAVSPIDGRYNEQTNSLRSIFSEYGLFKFRVQVEICWLQKLSNCSLIKEVPIFEHCINEYLNKIFLNFTINDAQRIKIIESTINHDVKAVEYFIKEKIKDIPELYNIREFVHFACTSEDINNIAYALMILTVKKEILLPLWNNIIDKIKYLSIKWRNVSMLSRTHGQPATPTTFGKEMLVFFYRLFRQYIQLNELKILGKMNGASGNYNAHHIAYPNVNWPIISKEFVESFGIYWNPYTTQIESHDYLVEWFNCIVRFNSILIDFVRDIWGYLSLNYLTQKVISSDIGSSTMPHKVNPIYFENAEGNLGIANACMNYFSDKLPISRWQRDLTDSTVLRNIGIGIGYSLIAYHFLLKGISTLMINTETLSFDLDHHWEILSEAIQIIMKRYGINNSYEIVKTLTRGKFIDCKSIHNFIDNLSLSDEIKIILKNMTPSNYTGYSVDLVNNFFKCD